MPRRRVTEELHEALEEAALAGAKEIKEFLGTYRGKDPDRLRRVQIAIGAVSGYTRWRASQNNMISMMLIAARQTGIGPQQTLELAKSAGLLAESSIPTVPASVVALKAAP
jgi:hypothetical protein